ncbi:MAG: hypothetical protein KA383_11715 [Phycisphaerae bacterium]|nr:hypothetical protein [Phycisphaerae bacterium]
METTAPSPAPTPPNQEAAPARRAAVVCRHDVLALAALGLVVGLACRGHFAMPHADFPSFVDAGSALLRGELPPTLTRAPVYPVLIAALGRLLPVEAAGLVVAEWLNALLLPLNAVLIYLIGRTWFGSAARWAAVWFLLLPMGLYCTAHVILEPLLITLVLLTLLVAPRGGAWPYVIAAVAIMTRYDVAGLIVGLGVADLLRRRPWQRVMLSCVLAAAPLLIWLGLTAVTWTPGWKDHYLTQMAARPAFDPGWALAIVARTCFEFATLRLPDWLASMENPARFALLVVPVLAAVCGAVVRIRARDRVAVTAMFALAGYLIVHALYAYRMDRYGYPMAPLLILFASAGLSIVVVRLKRRGLPPRVGQWLLIVLGIALASALLTEAQAFATAAGGAERLLGRVGLPALVALSAVWAAPLLLRRQRVGQVVLLIALALLLTLRIQTGAALLGTGQDMKNVVEAARWIRDHTPTSARVLCDNPGLLRLYAGCEPRDRFVSYEDVGGQTWPDVLVECRRIGIVYIIWHDRLSEMHAAYYAGRLGLARFDALADAEHAAGVRPERRFPNYPNLVIVRVLE